MPAVPVASGKVPIPDGRGRPSKGSRVRLDGCSRSPFELRVDEQPISVNHERVESAIAEQTTDARIFAAAVVARRYPADHLAEDAIAFFGIHQRAHDPAERLSSDHRAAERHLCACAGDRRIALGRRDDLGNIEKPENQCSRTVLVADKSPEQSSSPVAESTQVAQRSDADEALISVIKAYLDARDFDRAKKLFAELEGDASSGSDRFLRLAIKAALDKDNFDRVKTLGAELEGDAVRRGKAEVRRTPSDVVVDITSRKPRQ